MKIEIGGGEQPREGYYHFDIRADLPHLDIQGDVKHLPFRDCSIDEIFMVHVLEHIGWREVPQIIAECYRALSHNGIIRIYVPDLRLVAKQLLSNEIPFLTLINWIYGGQTYSDNFHKSGYDIYYMRKLLEDTNFHIVLLKDGDGLYVEAVKYPHPKST